MMWFTRPDTPRGGRKSFHMLDVIAYHHRHTIIGMDTLIRAPYPLSSSRGLVYHVHFKVHLFERISEVVFPLFHCCSASFG